MREGSITDRGLAIFEDSVHHLDGIELVFWVARGSPGVEIAL